MIVANVLRTVRCWWRHETGSRCLHSLTPFSLASLISKHIARQVSLILPRLLWDCRFYPSVGAFLFYKVA